LLASYGAHTPKAIRGFRLLHFPNLKSEALLFATGRAQARILALLRSPTFMRDWDITMRYARSASVTRTLAARWREDADKARAVAFF
jgi:hypothetical protein